MLHDLDLNHKNLHINELIFFAKSKKPYCGGIFGHCPQTEMFPPKSGSISFNPQEIIGTVFFYRWGSNNLTTKNFLDLLEFQESWNVIGRN